MKNKKIKVLGLILIFILMFIIQSRIPKSDRGKTIVVDPGHGGEDPGTVSSVGRYEKDINLDYGKKLSKELERRGYSVINTRTEDETVKNINRAELANRSGADLFISLHCNATENSEEVNGFQVLYYPSKASKQVSQSILASVLNRTGVKDMGIVERKDLIVLNQSNMPGVIVELGFLTNSREAKKLERKLYQKKMIKGIIEGVEDYFGEVEN